MKPTLTPAQARCFDALSRWLARGFSPPSILELAGELGMTKSGAEKHLHALRAKGAITGPRLVGTWKPTTAGERMRRALDQ